MMLSNSRSCLFLTVTLSLWLSACGLADSEQHGKIAMAKVGLGTAGLKPNTASVVKQALSRGVRLIDTAQAQEWYDEEGVGVGVSEFQNENGLIDDDIMIVTKIHPRSYSYKAMDLKLAESRRLLNRTSLDVVLLHTPYCWEGQCTKEELRTSWQTGWRNLEQLSEKHNIKAIGVSNFHTELLVNLMGLSNSKVSVVQNWMDPFHQDADTRAYCLEHRIHYMAYSSFGTQWQGRRFNYNPVLASNSKENKVLKDIASRYGVSIARVIIAWAIQMEGVTIIPRSAKAAHIEDNFGYLASSESLNSNDDIVSVGGLVLSDDDIKAITEMDGTIGEPWD